MALRPSLHFAGTAEEVLAFYRAALGGDVSIHRYGGSPAEAQAPANYKDKVLYGMLRSPYGEIAVMDAPPDRCGSPGDNFSISVEADDIDKAATMFASLSSGGNVMMPFDETFFAKRFGMAKDKYGINWMVTVNALDPVSP